MADEIVVVLNGVRKRLRDMGDGTHAEVMSAAGGGAVALTATIALTANASNALAIRGRLIGGFYIPASFEGGYIKFNRSLDGTNWSPVKDEFKTAIIYGATSGDFVRAQALDFVGVEYLQIISCDVSGTPVNQAGAAAVVTLALAA